MNSPWPISLLAGWDDLRVVESAIKVPAVGGPSTEAWNTSYQLLRFDNGASEVAYFTAQLPHDRVPKSDLRYHIHWFPATDIANGLTVDWSCSYSGGSIGALMVSATGSASLQYVSSGITPANTHKMTTEVTIPGGNLTNSAFLTFWFGRAGGVDSYAGNCYLLGTDLHYLRFRFGSQTY